MKDGTFNIHELSNVIVDSVFQDVEVNRETILPKIISCLQRNIDQNLVPNNYNAYESKKRRDARLFEIKKQDESTKFWKNIVKRLEPDNMQSYYDELNQLLETKGLRSYPKPGGYITCFYCEREIDAAKFGGERAVYSTMDHVVPKSKFGKNNIGNIVNACNECNSLKADLTLKQFIKMLEATKPCDRYEIIIKNAKKLVPKISHRLT